MDLYTKTETVQQDIDRDFIASIFQPENVDVILSKSTTVKYRKRETVIKSGEFVSHLILIYKGFVKVEIEKGKRNLILDIVPALNIIGLPVVLNLAKYDFSIVSLTECEVRLLPIDTIKSIISGNGKVAMQIINYSNDQFVFPMLNKLQCISHNNVRGRLAQLLLNLAQNTHQSKSFTLFISRTEMAEMIGFSRENVIRILSEFHTENIISISGKNIEIKNFPKLEELARYS